MTDVVVIGAGIVGAACAYHLTAAGLDVTVFERAETPASGSTGVSVAGVRVQFSDEVNVRLSWTSIQEYRGFAERYGTDAGYRPIGYLFLVPEAAWPEHLDAVEVQRRVGAPVEVLDLPEAQRTVPFITDGLAGATFGPADGIVDPYTVTRTFLDLARRGGATLRLGCPMLRAERRGGVWRLSVPGGTVEADHVVNAAGPWAGRVAASAGLSVDVQPVRRMVFATAPLRPPRVCPLTVDVASGFYLRSEADRILFGRSRPDEPPGFTRGIDWDWFEQVLRVGVGRFPPLGDMGLDMGASWWGYYEVTPDHNPVLGHMPDAPGWVNACGFSGHGVQQAPAVGRVIAEEIVQGRASTIDIDDLRIERFTERARRAERHII
jgi:sarcosine oxidase subunit beta